jgi:hypothetical protein
MKNESSPNESKKNEYTPRNIAAKMFASFSQGRNRVVKKNRIKTKRIFSFLLILSI